jgi:hypothetical protein
MKSKEESSLTKAVVSLAVRCVVKRRRNLVFLTLLVIAMLSLALPAPVAAQGLAISGTFYRQHFQLLPGETLRKPDIYLLVFNHEDEDIRVKLTTRTPPGVAIMLDQSNFAIPSGEHRKVEVGVSISTGAVPGDYVLAVLVEVQPTEGEGVTIAGAAEQQAKLTILEEAGEVHSTEDTTPIAEPYSISEFSVVPDYLDDSDRIAFASVEYTINNSYQPLKSARVILTVSFNDELLEQTEIISLPTLEPGSTSGSYKYIPSPGWQNGTYAFKLGLLSQDKVCAQSGEEKLEEAVPTPATDTNWQINWRLVGAIVGGLMIIVPVASTRRRLKRLVPGILALARLQKKAISFENPEFSAVSDKETGEPIMVKIVYGIRNQSKPVPEVRVELQVSKNNEHLENITLIDLNPLEKGVTNLEYDYAPKEGWQENAAYKFKLALYTAGQLHTVIPVSSRTRPAS